MADTFMRIGIDCRTILDETAREKAGIAHYTYYLVRTLLEIDKENEYVLFSGQNTSPSVIASVAKQSQGDRRVRRWRTRDDKHAEIQHFRFSLYKKFLPYVYSHILIANQIKKAKLDVYHSPANIVPLGLLKSRERPKLVTTIHDLAIYRHPEWFPPRQGFSIKYLVPQTIQKVDNIVVPSQVTKNDVMELFGVSQNKVNVIPHGVDPRFFTPSLNPSPPVGEGRVGGKYILFVGTLEPRKNLARLIQAYASLPRDILDEHDLLIAGQKGWKYQDVLDEIKNQKSKIKNKIKILGYYPGEKLPELMKNASVFVYPSLYEGFGLPVLEAMAAGVPIVTSKNSAMAEFATSPGLTPTLLVNPYSVSEIAAAIGRIIRDGAYTGQISQNASKLAREFSWQKTAKQTLEVYGVRG